MSSSKSHLSNNIDCATIRLGDNNPKPMTKLLVIVLAVISIILLPTQAPALRFTAINKSNDNKTTSLRRDSSLIIRRHIDEPTNKNQANSSDTKQFRLLNGDDDMRCVTIGDESQPEMSAKEAAKVDQLLNDYYLVPGAKVRATIGADSNNNYSKADDNDNNDNNVKPTLPHPLNVTVLIISWYPPVLKLSWQLNDFGIRDADRLNFYKQQQQQTGPSSFQVNGHDTKSAIKSPADGNRTRTNLAKAERRKQEEIEADSLRDQFDFKLAIEQQQENGIKSEEDKLERELKMRQFLLEKSLTCFQVTYNIVNSRFKVTEEYPPYLRSITLERLLPATEYSLRVVAVYLNGRYRLPSSRVSFVSPTDNESRRFKENTYRPIHRYPDERPRELRIGLAQVRSEELTIVAIAVVFWIATICLFFNKWGKIRMLEPYQPAYRDQSGSSASFATAHQHASAHNLGAGPGGGTGSCGTGSGAIAASAKMSSFCAGFPTPTLTSPVAGGGAAVAVGATADPLLVAAAVPPLTAFASPTTPVAPAAGEPALQKGAARNSEGGLAAGRKPSRSLLLLGTKRFETVANDNSPIVSGARRTDAELNYLFQSKALALSKATSLWSRQQQKLRQLQYCRGPAIPAQLPVAAVTAPEQQLEMLRRTSQALLKQRGLSTQCAPLASHLTHQTAADRKSSDGCELQQATTGGGSLQRGGPTSSSPWASLKGSSVGGRAHRLLRQQLHQQQQQQQQPHSLRNQVAGGTKSLDWREDSEDSMQVEGAGLAHRVGQIVAAEQRQQQVSGSNGSSVNNSSSNRMRRLLFITKSHQHHHVATSTSSSTLLKTNSASIPNSNYNSSSYHYARQSTTSRGDQAATGTGSSGPSSSLQINSVSLDNEASCDRQGVAQGELIAGVDSMTSSSSLPAKMRGLELVGAGGRLPQLAAAATSGSPTPSGRESDRSSPTGSVQLATCQKAAPPPRVQTSGCPADGPGGRLVQHHILIEPPSPPTQLDPQRQARSSDSIQGHQSSPTAATDGRHSAAGSFFEPAASSRQQRQPEVGARKQWITSGECSEEQGEDDAREEDEDHARRPLSCPNNYADSQSEAEAEVSQRRSRQRQQPAICLEGAAESERHVKRFVELSNEPFVKLASYQANARRQTTAFQQPYCYATGATYGQQSQQPAAHSCAVGSQLAHCQTLGQIQQQHPYRLRHQSFCSECMAASAIGHFSTGSSGGSFQRQQLQLQLQQRRASHRPASGTFPEERSYLSLVGGSQSPICGDRQSSSASQAAAQAAAQVALSPHFCSASRPLESGAHSIGGRQLRNSADAGCATDCCCCTDSCVHQQSTQEPEEDGSGSLRPRMSSVFVASPYSRAHRDSFALLRALSQKKSKSAEDVAYLSSLVLQIWVRDRNPLLQSVSQQQLSSGQSRRQQEQQSAARARQKPKSSLTVAHI